MKSERKISLQEKRIKQLQKELQEERELIAVLKKANKELAQKNTWLQDHSDTVVSELRDNIKALKLVKAEYRKLIEDTKVQRKNYENKMADLLKKFKRQI